MPLSAQQRYESIAEVADEILGGKEQVKQLESIDLAMQDGNGKLRVLSYRTYFAYLKISEGCDNRCTYCVIPQMRGRHRSRELESLVDSSTKLICINNPNNPTGALMDEALLRGVAKIAGPAAPGCCVTRRTAG